MTIKIKTGGDDSWKKKSKIGAFISNLLHQPHGGGGGAADADAVRFRQVNLLQLFNISQEIAAGVVSFTYII